MSRREKLLYIIRLPYAICLIFVIAFLVLLFGDPTEEEDC